jgi:ribonuclease Z
MRPSFHPRTVNGPFDDPGLFIPFTHERRALLFDAGDTTPLSTRDALKISHVFISHTHMDHFIGFDRLLRLALGREKTLHLFGPANFLKNLEGKLAGYTWNLTHRYENRLAIHATEVRRTEQAHRVYDCRTGFATPWRGPPRTVPFDPELLREPALTVRTAILDHQIPCLGFRLEERFHVNILKDRLIELGLDVGPWLTALKSALFAGEPDDAPFRVPTPEGGRVFSLGALRDRIARITPGQRIAYITDVAGTPDNISKMIDLARGVDHLFIEAAFLDADRVMAAEKAHLTAAQAGRIAALAEVGAFSVFHFSPRYAEMPDRLIDEARRAAAETATDAAHAPVLRV